MNLASQNPIEYYHENHPANPDICYRVIINRAITEALKDDVRAILTLIACAIEPLDEAALNLLITNKSTLDQIAVQRVEAGLLAGKNYLTTVATREQTEGFRLRADLQDYLVNSQDDGGLTAARNRAKLTLCRAAERWAQLPAGNLRNHLLRCGNHYLLNWRGAAGVQSARQSLSDFAYLQARIAISTDAELVMWLDEYQRVLAALPIGQQPLFQPWVEFFCTLENILGSAARILPTAQLLAHLAINTDTANPVHQAAVRWLKTGAQ